jgi:hypothetical protein
VNVYEVIREDAGGKSDLVSKGLATEDEIDAFRSVHYPSALWRDDSRSVTF